MKKVAPWVWIISGYIAALMLMTWLTISQQIAKDFYFIFAIPAILSAYFYRRWLYVTLHFLAAAASAFVSYKLSSNFWSNWVTIAIAALSSLILAEILRNLVVAREKAESALRASEARLSQVIQSSPIPIFVIDGQHIITYWNRACARLTGVPAKEILGTRKAWRPFYESERPVMADLILEHAEKDTISRYYDETCHASELIPGAYTGEVYFPSSSNRWQREAWILFSAAPLIDTEGQIVGAIEALQDVSEQKQTEIRMREHNAQLEALRAISLDLTTELDLDTLLHSIIEYAVDFLEGNHGGLYLYRPARDILERVISTGPNALTVGGTLSRGEGLSGLIWERGEPLYINDYQAWEGAAINLGAKSTSVIGAPIQWGDEFLGVINISHRSETLRPFTNADAELLSLFAGQAAIAIRNARLYEQAQRRALEQKTLREASLVLTRTRARGEVIEEILAQLQEVVPYDTASVQLLKGHKLELVGGRGFPNLEELLGIAFDLHHTDNPNREVIRKRGSFIVADAPEIYGAFKEEPHAQAGIRAWLGVPLLADEKLLGMIALDKQEPDFYTEDHVRLAEAFAAQAAIVVKNTQLLEAAQQQSERLRKTLTLSELLHQGLAIEEVLQKIAQGAASLGFNRAAINVYDSEADVIHPKAIVGLTSSEREALEASVFHWKDVQALFQEQFRMSHSFLIRQESVDWETALPEGVVIASELEDRGLDYWRPDDSLLVPLWNSQGDPIGLLSVDEPTDGRIPDLDTIRTLETFANQAAIAIENAQLVEDLEAKVAARTAEIAAERDNSNAILQSVGHPIAIVDNEEHRIQYVNEAFVNLSGYLEEELLNARIDHLIEERIFEDYLPALLLAETQGRGWQGDLSVKRKDGRSREVLASIVALHNADGESVGYITSYQDVSRLNALDRARREFIDNISHQLRTPLTTIGLLIDLLHQEESTIPANLNYIQMMRAEIDTLKHLVEDILTVASLDSGEALEAWVPISFPDILEHIATCYQEHASSNGIVFSVRPPPPMLPTVYGDSEQIIRLLSELVENALNFTPVEERVTVETDIVRRNHQAWVTIAVQDTGPGLTSEELERVFGRFFRGRLSASGNTPGTGLGLSIAQSLARAHGGQITVKSQIGEGATFTVWFPGSRKHQRAQKQ
jgi:PAS domain S-box-containing protein